MPARPIASDEQVSRLSALVRDSRIAVLDAYAEAEGISRATAARRAVEEFVSRADVRAVAGLAETGEALSA